MKILLQKSNIYSFIYIFIGSIITFMFFDLFLNKLETYIAFFIYYITMLLVIDEMLICMLHKIKYNLPASDLKRIQVLLQEIVYELNKKGYILPKSYRIGYINNPDSFEIIAYSRSQIAVSRDLLDTLDDRQLKALLTHQCIQMHYKILDINQLVFISNIVVLIGYILYVLMMLIIKGVVSLFSKPAANITSIFFISQPTIMIYIMHKLKSKATLENDYKCDEEVCKLGMKYPLLEALSYMYNDQRMKGKYAKDLYLRIFKVKSY